MSETSTEERQDFVSASTEPAPPGADLMERFQGIVSVANETLDKVDWSQIGRVAKATGIILAVIVAQILIKGVIDTINLLPLVPGLLELLGLVVVGKWSWDNLATGEKRQVVFDRLQTLRKEYIG
ncbi:MAG: CAAD domain-containing protein [Synechococcaceae cyanobacterium]